MAKEYQHAASPADQHSHHDHESHEHHDDEHDHTHSYHAADHGHAHAHPARDHEHSIVDQDPHFDRSHPHRQEHHHEQPANIFEWLLAVFHPRKFAHDHDHSRSGSIAETSARGMWAIKG